MKNSATINVKKLVYAIMTDEDNETYGAVKSAPELIDINIAPKVDSATLYASGIAVENQSAIGDIAVTVGLHDLPLEIQADWLGHILDPVTGSMQYNTGDSAPYLALGYQRVKANKKSRYVWLYKVKFQDNSEDGKTKGETLTFQTPSITGVGVANKNGDWKNVADEDSGSSPATAAYLDNVPASGTPDLVAPTVTTAPLDAATGVAIGASVVFTFNKAIREDDITAGNFFLLKAGVPVACGLVASAGNTVVTMKPTSNMSAGAHMAICTSDVKSIYGVAIAAAKITNFTV